MFSDFPWGFQFIVWRRREFLRPVLLASLVKIYLDPIGKRIIVIPSDVTKKKNDEHMVVYSTRDFVEYIVESVFSSFSNSFFINICDR